MAAKRLTRKQLLKEPDEFITTTGRLIGWAKENLKMLGYGAAIFFGIIVLISGFRYYNQSRANAASRLLGQALENYRQLASDKDADQAFEAVKPAFEQLVDDYKRQPAGKLGMIYLGHIAMSSKQPETAVAYYRQALPLFADDPSLSVIIRYGLATALQQTGDSAGAIEHYEKIVSASGSAYKDSALFHLGLLYESAGQRQKSREMFQTIEKDFPDSVFAQIARDKIAG